MWTSLQSHRRKRLTASTIQLFSLQLAHKWKWAVWSSEQDKTKTHGHIVVSPHPFHQQHGNFQENIIEKLCSLNCLFKCKPGRWSQVFQLGISLLSLHRGGMILPQRGEIPERDPLPTHGFHVGEDDLDLCFLRESLVINFICPNHMNLFRSIY